MILSIFSCAYISPSVFLATHISSWVEHLFKSSALSIELFAFLLLDFDSSLYKNISHLSVLYFAIIFSESMTLKKSNLQVLPFTDHTFGVVSKKAFA